MTVAPTRRLALLLALSASFGLAACGGGGGGDSGTTTPPNTDPNGWNAVTTLKTADTVAGTGTAVASGQLVSLAYTGWIYDVRVTDTKGTKIDSNVGATPLSFVVGSNSLISGFEQGVVGMKPGGKRTLTTPANLAYGSAGKLPAVPANAALVFDIEMDPNGWTGVTALKTVDSVVGTGASADAGKTVSVTYTGWLYDVHATNTKGTQFDSNVGKPTFSFKLGAGGVIAGFDQGIQGMKVGSKRTITIPASLGYGNAGQGSIPGGAPLVFDVEVTAVN